MTAAHASSRARKAEGLYDPAFEHDACGVAFVATLSGVPSHAIVAQGLEALRNLDHRGAVGSDPKTGDGAVVAVDHLGVYPHQRDIAAENGFVLRGRRRVPNNAGQEQQQTDNTYPRHRSIELAIR